MATILSPGVLITETDATTTVPGVASTIGAFAGNFTWGPVDTPVFVDSENTLVQLFGKPTEDTNVDFLTLAAFLAYGGQAFVVRAQADDRRNAVSSNRKLDGTFAAANASETFTASYDNVDAAEGLPNLGRATDHKVVSGLTNAAYNSATTVIAIDGITDADAQVFGSDNLPITTDNFVVDNGGADSDAQNTFATSLSGYNIAVRSTAGLQHFKITSAARTAAGAFTLTIPSFDASTDNIADDTEVFLYPDEFALYQPLWVARFPGETGNNLQVAIVDSSVSDYANATIRGTTTWQSIVPNAPAQSQYLQDADVTFSTTATDASGRRNDEVHIAVIDRTGDISGVQGTVLEVFPNLSKAKDAKNDAGASIYWQDVIENESSWIYPGPGNFRARHATLGFPDVALNWYGGSGNVSNGEDAHDGWDLFNSTYDSTTDTNALYRTASVSSLNAGATGTAESGDKVSAYEHFEDVSEFDISFIITPEMPSQSDATLAQELVDISKKRQDTVTFYSPIFEDSGNNKITDRADALDLNLATRNTHVNRNTSYALMDCNWKQTYDKYNDKFVWIPLSGDIAGLAARTDNAVNTWTSFGGFNRGQLLGVVKLAWNPTKADRDRLYAAGINPVASFPGQGTVLFGDKTTLSRPSTFSRIGARRLFITLRKAIGQAAQYQLFEQNDDFSRGQFLAYVNPYLARIQSQRGIDEFYVVCDNTNNSPTVIANHEFVADVFVKPVNSINFIRLNFTAVGPNVEFNEIIGA